MTTLSPVAEDATDTTGEEALAAIHVGIWVSATRCLLTYVVAPAAGALGLLLGPLGLLLQVAGAITASYGARRLWPLQHRLRVPYLGLAVVVDLVTVVALARWAGTVWSATLR